MKVHFRSPVRGATACGLSLRDVRASSIAREVTCPSCAGHLSGIGGHHYTPVPAERGAQVMRCQWCGITPSEASEAASREALGLPAVGSVAWAEFGA